MTTTNHQNCKMSQARRRVLSLAICASSHEAGFTTADESAIDLLTVMLESIITEAGRSAQLLAEHNGRVDVTPKDAVLALIEMGLTVDSKEVLEYGKRRNIIRIPAPGGEQAHKKPPILQLGQSRLSHPSIPEHYPPFPDAHTYIRTPTHRQPISEYEAIRDKAATQKRDLERALTRLVAKSAESKPENSLFADNHNLNKYFPLIPIQPSALPFLDALIPKDQIFDEDESD